MFGVPKINAEFNPLPLYFLLKRLLSIFAVVGIVLFLFSAVYAEDEPQIHVPVVALKGVPFTISFEDLPTQSTLQIDAKNLDIPDSLALQTAQESTVNIKDVSFRQSGKHVIHWSVDGVEHTKKLHVLPGLLSLVPPLLAILMALITKQILISLFVGIWIGVIFLSDYSIIHGFLTLLDTYIIESVSDASHASIIVFTLAFGGMIGVVAKNGGMKGIVEKISKFASTNRSGQVSTIMMGVLIFFDDYANTLLVGNTMRAFTDKLRVSREKLSYLVDSTAAPITSMALISTWVGFEIGLIQQSFDQIGIHTNVYLVFIETIPYRFYSLFALIFVFMIALTQRDYGPMLKAEKRAMHTGKVLRDGATPLTDTSELEMPEGIPYRWYNAIIPILTVIVVMMIGLYYSGYQALPEGTEAKIWEIIGNSDSFSVLIWASFSGSLVALILSIGQGILSIPDAIDAWIGGVKAMVLAVTVLVLAWSLSRICGEIQTAEYIIKVTEGILRPEIVPVLTFVTAAVVSFATGTSWGTMAILIPIVIPLMANLLWAQGMSAVDAQSFLATFAAVLSGSVFGDHCSPISDTTILSSMASGSDHIDHVKTQIPYAIVVGIIAILTGYFPAGMHWNWYIFTPIGLALMLGFLFMMGKPIQARDELDLSEE